MCSYLLADVRETRYFLSVTKSLPSSVQEIKTTDVCKLLSVSKAREKLFLGAREAHSHS